MKTSTKPNITLPITRKQNYLVIIWLILWFIVISLRFWAIFRGWQTTSGNGEYFWIAQGIAEGQGFSIDAYHRWFFINPDLNAPTGEYFTTAIEEPIYPYVMALAMSIFGDSYQLPILICQVIAASLTPVVTYYLGRKIFSDRVAILAALTLTIFPMYGMVVRGIGSPTILLGLMVSISAYAILWCLESLSVRKGMTLGLLLGFNCLIHSATLLFVPLAILLVLTSVRPFKPVVWKTALAIALCACLVISPWTMRNFIVFQKLVPIRTGMGLNVHQGNPILGATFAPTINSCSDTLGSLWQADNAREALITARARQEKRNAIYWRSQACIEQTAPRDYANFNEAERDKVFLNKTIEFVVTQPKIFITLVVNKFAAFFLGWNRIQAALIAPLALIGALIALCHPKTRVLVLLILAYSVPYLLAVQWFYRYRYPIESLILLLASFGLVSLIKWLKNAIYS